MEYVRKMIYLSTYEDGIKTGPSGYVALSVRKNVCDVQLFYRSSSGKDNKITPVYVFCDGTVTRGEETELREGVAIKGISTERGDFMQSKKSLEELEAVYIDGILGGMCAGRVDGGVPEERREYTVLQKTETSEQIKDAEENTDAQRWSMEECIQRFPKWNILNTGEGATCYRMNLEDMHRLPEEWDGLSENSFLLHGYHEFQHLVLLFYGRKEHNAYAIGVPGEFCPRTRYMAEVYGISKFVPLEQGRCRKGCFGYWLLAPDLCVRNIGLQSQKKGL